MRKPAELLDFLLHTMSMTDIYQPVVVLHLLERDGTSSRADLARTLSGYDEAVQEYYDKILMRWPKITLTKHKVIQYDRKHSSFVLNFDLDDAVLVEQAKDVCEQKIRDWIAARSVRRGKSKVEPSMRFRVLKAARGKCELCGISSKICPIDIDHIVPRSQADKFGYVLKDSVRLSVDDERNLQALCYRCNRAKRDQDATDFRQPRSKIVREQTAAYQVSTGVASATRQLTGSELTEKLFEKLIDEHARLIDQNASEPLIERVADMLEVVVTIAKASGYSEGEIIALMHQRRAEFGGFDAGIYLVDGAA
jgi:predicted house-cleaning noncanonical NTP pyrophosphatase (MazG superfamily)